VPNIKFNVAKVLESIFSIVDQSVSIMLSHVFHPYILFSLCHDSYPMNIIAIQVVEKTIRPCLVELSEDPDVDVRYFSSQALQAIDHVMMAS
jgi:serine/threonine-protein phosphatase 2A regulatory subunit A